ncbi:hypothetical protein EVA_14491 [gut metagenome]|uniref:Uncharacterized protein n=1 Tax=gut metagenome TaxID=749906 RepID=J9FSC3_9ZZZZ
MNAIRDTETGEMVATDVIAASKVTARFRNLAERNGQVEVEFDINVPSSIIQSRWRLKLVPELTLMDLRQELEPVYITGMKYRERQLRGYQRYQAFINSIISDTTVFIRKALLETFLQRHYPDTYAMKTDSSFVPEPEAENIFGVPRNRYWNIILGNG